jgi:hypothetical protein
MTATPHLTGGVPDGTETISGLESLSRSIMNAAGQVVEQDHYFDLTGVTYANGAANVHLGSQHEVWIVRQSSPESVDQCLVEIEDKQRAI